MIRTGSARRPIALLVAVIVTLMPSGVRAASPTLRLAAAPDYSVAVEGHGWSHGQLIALTVYADGETAGIQLRPGIHGYFKVGVQLGSRCESITFKAADLAGRTAKVRSVGPLCPSPTNAPAPVLTILRGTPVSTARHRVLAPHGPGRVTLKLGNRLYLWEPGTAAPMFDPHVDARYLVLLEQSRTPPRACPAVDCAEGFEWTWVASRVGTTPIDLSPACRLVHPPCEIADYAITVTIVR